MNNDALQILESVHNYYSDAFSSLVLYTTALMAIAGVFIPLLIQFYNSRAQATTRLAAEELIRLEVQKALTELRETLKIESAKNDKLLDEKLLALDSKIRKKLIGVEGGTFHVQGNTHLDSKIYDLAIESFCNAARCYIKSENEPDLQQMMAAITEECFPKLNEKHFEENPDTKEAYEKLLTDITAFNVNNRYTIAISDMKRAANESFKRKPPAIRPPATKPPPAAN